ncbi:MAG: leucine-rich repeat domain-containing protein [Paludibacteraceae bacterium]|nr:leucine-rich repeat domain-containing protein [Paludibacteraceae bacterium]
MLEKIIKGIKYSLDEETMTAEVIAKRNGYEGDIIIPETVVSNRAAFLVTSIGENAFFDCKSLTTITLPNSVKRIKMGAFIFCSSLTSMTIPNSVTTIEDNAFLCCSKLTSITIGNSVKSIGYCAFENCESLTEITLPNSIKSLGYYIFGYCFSLETISYNGTRDKWEKVKKDTFDDKWNSGILAKFVQCTDGDVEI